MGDGLDPDLSLGTSEAAAQLVEIETRMSPGCLNTASDARPRLGERLHA